MTTQEATEELYSRLVAAAGRIEEAAQPLLELPSRMTKLEERQVRIEGKLDTFSVALQAHERRDDDRSSQLKERVDELHQTEKTRATTAAERRAIWLRSLVLAVLSASLGALLVALGLK